jgi:SSS family solute:Na+ symporter
MNIEAFKDIRQSVIDMNCPLNLLSPINAGAFAMILSLILVPIISSFTKAPEKNVVENAFSSLNEAK